MTAPVKNILQNTRQQRFILLEIPEDNRKFVAPRLINTDSFKPEACSITLAFGRYFFADINEGHIPFLLNHYEGTRGGKVESHAFNADLLVILEADSQEEIEAFQTELLGPIKEEIHILESVNVSNTDALNTFTTEQALLDEEEGFFNGGSYLFWQSLTFPSAIDSSLDLQAWDFASLQINDNQKLHCLIFSSTSINIEDYLDEQFGVRNSEANASLAQSECNLGAYFFLPSDETLKELK